MGNFNESTRPDSTGSRTPSTRGERSGSGPGLSHAPSDPPRCVVACGATVRQLVGGDCRRHWRIRDSDQTPGARVLGEPEGAQGPARPCRGVDRLGPARGTLGPSAGRGRAALASPSSRPGARTHYNVPLPGTFCPDSDVGCPAVGQTARPDDITTVGPVTIRGRHRRQSQMTRTSRRALSECQTARMHIIQNRKMVVCP